MEHKASYYSDLLKFCFTLPKIDLHAHLNGSIRKSTLYELLSEDDREKISQLFQNQMSFSNAFDVFRISSKILTSISVLRRITREVIEDWVKTNCIYLEIRTSLKSLEKKGKENYLRAVLEEIQKGNELYDMKTRLIISLNRCLPIDDFIETLEIYKNFSDEKLKKLIVGVDYSGYEEEELHRYEDIIPIFNQFRELGLKVTIHMGESKIYQPMDFNQFRPDRVSHTYYFKEEECEEIMKNKIPIEICPTGSYSIKNLNSYKHIPFNNYHKKRITTYNGEEYEYNLYCINTDDTMLFNTDLTHEYYEVAANFEISKEELKQTVLNTVDYIFESDEEFRDGLKKKIQEFRI